MRLTLVNAEGNKPRKKDVIHTLVQLTNKQEAEAIAMVLEKGVTPFKQTTPYTYFLLKGDVLNRKGIRTCQDVINLFDTPQTKDEVAS